MKYLLYLNLLFTVFEVSAVQMKKAFYHRGQCEDKLVFYFDKAPSIVKAKGGSGYEYTLQNVQVSKVAQQALVSINAERGIPGYQMNTNCDSGSCKIRFKLSSNNLARFYVASFKPISAPAGLSIKILRSGVGVAKACVRKLAPKEIVIDFGHGGKDPGAVVNGVAEKDIARSVGLKLVSILKGQGYSVYLTRKGDEYVALDDRTRNSNLHSKASLFVSLHANYSGNQKAQGIETYFMHYNLMRGIDGSKLNREQLNSRSSLLATRVHSGMLGATKNSGVVDRKVKQSVSQVLLGVEMPAILIELGFLSNPKEAQLLSSDRYQTELAAGISKGINSYLAAV